MTDNLPLPAGAGDILFYQTEDGRTRIQVRFEDGTLWLSQAQMATLYQSTKQSISFHLRTIFREGELVESSVVKNFLTTAVDGKNYHVSFYHLDAEAVKKALAAFARYDEHRRINDDIQAETDFDRMLDEIKQLPKS